MLTPPPQSRHVVDHEGTVAAREGSLRQLVVYNIHGIHESQGAGNGR